MSLNVSETPSYDPAPEGLHNAVCIMVIDLGVQAGKFGPKSQVLLTWELVEALMDDERPFTLSRRFTASLAKKSTLRPLLESWRGRSFTKQELEGFSLKNVLGKPCQVMVKHNQSADGSRTYANVISVVPAAKGTRLTPANEVLSYDHDVPDPAVLEKLPEWIRTAIAAAIHAAAPPSEDDNPGNDRADFDDDIPF